MQDGFFPSGTDIADLLVEILRFPFLEHLRLALGKIPAHGEIGLGKIECVLVFAHGLVIPVWLKFR